MDNSKDLMISAKLSYKDHLNLYLNTWNQQLVARTIDMQTDLAACAVDPKATCLHHEQGRAMEVTYEERLEIRKTLVQDALTLIAAIKHLVALSDEEYETNYLSAAALAPKAIEAEVVDTPEEAQDATIVEEPAKTVETTPEVAEPAPEAIPAEPAPVEPAAETVVEPAAEAPTAEAAV